MNGKANLNIWLLVWVLLLVLAGPVGAVTYYVNPGDSIQSAINAASNGDEIEVAPGTYNEAINFLGKAVRLYSSGGPDVTTIDGSSASYITYHVVQCVSGEDANTILEGFTITGGNANGTGSNALGGGMYNYTNSNPTVNNCTFTGNEALGSGGGMFNEMSASPTVTNCTFSGNSASSAGGGMYGGRAVVNNCIFSGNSASGGGGMYCGQSTTVTNCTFSNNTATSGRGGGMEIRQSSPTVANCKFISNQSGGFGGGMYNYDSSPMLINCTFSGNRANTSWGGGISNYSSNPTVTNCILWGDTPDEIHDLVPSTTTVTYSDVEGGWPGTANIDADPCFVDASNPDPNLWNLRLKPDSPCIDRGDSTALSTLSALLDLDGNFRCFDVFTIPNTGYGPLKFLDMGAYEFHCISIAGDINCDGVVDFKDVAILCNNWLTGAEPK
jgi:parallel beta-helix repeat protein